METFHPEEVALAVLAEEVLVVAAPVEAGKNSKCKVYNRYSKKGHSIKDDLFPLIRFSF